MATTTRINVASVVSQSGPVTVEGAPNAIVGLSDNSASSGIVIPNGKFVKLQFKLSAADIAQLPDGLVSGVSFFMAASYTRTNVPRTFPLPGGGTFTLNGPNPNEYLATGAALGSFDLTPGGAGANVIPNVDFNVPTITGIDSATLTFGVLTVDIDATRLVVPAHVHTLYLSVTTNERPTVTPGGYIFGGDRPTIFFGFNDPEGSQLEAFRMKLFTKEQATAPGFDPNTATPVQYSGTVYSATPSYVFDDPLGINQTYRAFITASEAGSNGRFTEITASRPYVEFSITADPGPMPTLTAEHASNPARV